MRPNAKPGIPLYSTRSGCRPAKRQRMRADRWAALCGQREGRPGRMLQTYNAVQSGVLVDRGHNRAARDCTQYQFLHVV